MVNLILSTPGLSLKPQESILDIDTETNRLTYKIDNQGNAHFLYISGLEPFSEPSGEPLFPDVEYKLIYGFRDSNNGEIELFTFDVDDIFPYHYNLQIDSAGQVHVAFIANYTLYYGLRSSSSTWTYTQLNLNTNWRAYQPDIALGINDDPRIVYSAIYEDGASDYFGLTVQTGYRALHYAVKNLTGWFYYDVSMNTGALSAKSFTSFIVYNPGILVYDSTVYLSYNVDNILGSSSFLEFLRFSEFPDIEMRDSSFDEFKFPKIYEASVRATKFRRPSIFTINNDIVILVGTWKTGGGLIGYLNDISTVPDISDVGSTTDQWEIFQIENNRRALSIESFTGILIEDQNRIVAVYSTYHLFNEEEGRFNEDILFLSFSPSNGVLGPIETGRLTDTTDVHHKYPAVSITGNNLIQINWLSWDQINNTKLFEDEIDLSAYSFRTSINPGYESTGSEDTNTVSTSLHISDFNYIDILIIGFILVIIVSLSYIIKKTHFTKNYDHN